MTQVTRCLEVSSLELSCSDMVSGSPFLSYYVLSSCLTRGPTMHLSLLQCVTIDSFLEAHCMLGCGPGDTSFSQ